MFPCKITRARVSRLQHHKQMGVWLRLSRITGINSWSCGKPFRAQALRKLSRTKPDRTTITPCTTPPPSPGQFHSLPSPLSRPQMISMATRCQQQSTGHGHLSHISNTRVLALSYISFLEDVSIATGVFITNQQASASDTPINNILA